MSRCLTKLINLTFAPCVENLLRGINDLIELVKKLQRDIANQHEDIRRLQSLIENCAGCREAQPLRLDTCQYANPCFQGKFSCFLYSFYILFIIKLNLFRCNMS
jgi:hypothetical protein